MIEIQLDSVRVDFNKSEYDDKVNRASALGFESTGYGDNLQKLCLKLVKAGHTGAALVSRGKSPVFHTPIDVERVASGKFGRGPQPEHLKGAT